MGMNGSVEVTMLLFHSPISKLFHLFCLFESLDFNKIVYCFNAPVVMITSEKFWHDNQARNQRGKKGGDWGALFKNLKSTLILLPYFSHLWINFCI